MSRRQAFLLLREEVRGKLADTDEKLNHLRRQAAEILREREALLTTLAVIEGLTGKKERRI